MSARSTSGITAPAAQGDADVDLLAALMQHVAQNEVAPGPHDTTIAGLVKRCQSQPASEAARCRQRICTNYWGKADACPRSLQAAPAPRGSARLRADGS